jgi:Glycosyl transferases group 1
MNLFLLSSRSIVSSVAWDTVFELENIFVETCNAKLLLPIQRDLSKWAFQSPYPGTDLFDKVLKKTTSRYRSPDQLPELSDGPNVLLMIGIGGNNLELLSSIPNWRKRFDFVIAYIFDSWGSDCYAKEVYQIDHLFVALPEVIDSLKSAFGIPVSLIPFAADVLNRGSGETDRLIDLTSFGRIPQQFNDVFFSRFNRLDSNRIYYRSTPRSSEMFPNLPYEKRLDQEDVRLLFHILRKTKITPAFDTLYPGMRRFPYSFITLRWFYGWATGCVVVGKKPTTPLFDELTNWENATIELPDDPNKAVELIEELLDDKKLLHSIHRRNYVESLAKHDWRMRIQNILQEIKFPLPDPLNKDLYNLRVLHDAHIKSI